jgi:hypothetical protein
MVWTLQRKHSASGYTVTFVTDVSTDECYTRVITVTTQRAGQPAETWFDSREKQVHFSPPARLDRPWDPPRSPVSRNRGNFPWA